jgi:glucose/arabinose dehydrogenase
MGNHNGGSMEFGADGMLYLGVGDAGVSADSQDVTNLNGKILRLDVDDPAHLIPSDNPFVNKRHARGEIWAFGFRNPFTAAVQPETGQIIVNDVGSDGSVAREEVDVLTRGGNYGWPNVEGIARHKGYIDPIFTYRHNAHGSGAITGGVFYSGRALGRKFNGKYLFSDYIQEFIDVLDTKTGVVSTFATGADTPIDLDQAPDGGVYYLSVDGSVHEISFVG